MAYNPSLGLLGDQQSLAPSLGLLGRLGNPGEDPIQAALAQMAAQRAQMAPGQGVGAPGAFIPPAPPSQAGGPPGAPEPAPTPPRPAPATRRPLISPTQMALFAAGRELAREDAPSLAHAVSRALAAGVPAFLTSKQTERDQAKTDAKERKFRGQVDDMVGQKLIDPATAAVARGMTSIEGRKFIAEMHKRGRQTTALKPQDRLVDYASGALIAEGAPKDETLTLSEGELAFSRSAEGGWEKVAEGGAKQTAPPDAIEAALFKAGLPAGTKPDTLPPALRGQVWKDAKEYRRSAAASGSTILNMGRGLAETVAPILQKEQEDAAGTVNTLPAIDRALGLLPNIIAGAGAPTITTLGNALMRVGLIPPEGKEGKRIAATQQYLTNVAQLVLPQTKALGTGNGFTDKDREFLENAVGGRIANTPEAIQGTLVALQKASYIKGVLHNRRVDHILEGEPEPVRETYRVRLGDIPASLMDKLPGESNDQWAARMARGGVR